MTHTIFISYAAKDDLSVAGKPGWVTTFCEDLKNTLTGYLGDIPFELLVYNPQKGEDPFGDLVEKHLSDHSILISIYSPFYLKYKWYKKEAEIFIERDIDLKVNGRPRIFKVIKDKVARRSQADFMQSQLGYNFFVEKAQLERFGDEALRNQYLKGQYVDKIMDLAGAIARTIEAIASEGNNEPARIAYLAEMPDYQSERDAIRRILVDHGFLVLPGENLSILSEMAFRNEARELMTQSEILIQMLGSDMGSYVGSRSNKSSAVKLQNELMVNEFGDKRRLFCNMKVRRKGDMHKFVRDFLINLDEVNYHPVGLIDVLRDVEQMRKELEIHIKKSEESE